MSTIMPKWRKPKEKSEADSLIVDIILFLESHETDSAERELALKNAFTIATYCPKDISRQQYTDIMSILWAYGEEAISPVLLAVGDCSISEVLTAAKDFVLTYNEPREMTREDTLKEIKDRYTAICQSTFDDNVLAGRSVLAWRDHKLYYFHPGGLRYEVEIKDRYTTTVHGSIVETIIHLTDEEKKGLTISGPLPSFKPAKRPWYDNDLALWAIFVGLILAAITALSLAAFR